MSGSALPDVPVHPLPKYVYWLIPAYNCVLGSMCVVVVTSGLSDFGELVGVGGPRVWAAVWVNVNHTMIAILILQLVVLVPLAFAIGIPEMVTLWRLQRDLAKSPVRNPLSNYWRMILNLILIHRLPASVRQNSRWFTPIYYGSWILGFLLFALAGVLDAVT